LANIQNSLNLPCGFTANNGALPRRAGDLFEIRLDFGKAQEVYVGILLLILAILF
jgi:hypothetical protein